MAKWGEGDPRWIVEERPDATNVNNWHWTEKNAGPWSREKLKELLKDFEVLKNGFVCKITEVDKIEGEASANNRKGKLIFFYEWDLTLKWEGRLAGAPDVVKGEVKIPNLSEENDVSEVEVRVTVKDSGEVPEMIKQFMHSHGRDKIREQLKQYLVLLREEFSQGMILPKKGEKEVKPDNVSTISSGFNKKISMNPVVASDPKTPQVGLKLDVKTIDLSEKLQCKGREFYDAMTRIEMVTAFTRGHVKMEAEKGGHFVLFGGNISGTFLELVPGKKIVQTWRYKQWPENHFSTVTMNIEEKSDHTLVTVQQTSVPSAEYDATKKNWEHYYFESMKRTFGFGVFL